MTTTEPIYKVLTICTLSGVSYILTMPVVPVPVGRIVVMN